jgi:REP element-mobilizing transposase RayT
MTLYKKNFRIESSRLKEWDYSTPWWYYVTICTKDMKCCFGEIKRGKMILNDLGNIANQFWNEIPKHYRFVELDCYVIMPNHFHGTTIINSVETGHAPSLQMKRPTLGNVIGSFKSAVSKWANKNGYNNFKWQPLFYDHIIRNEKDLHRIRTYIQNNPLKWELDEYYRQNDNE